MMRAPYRFIPPHSLAKGERARKDIAIMNYTEKYYADLYGSVPGSFVTLNNFDKSNPFQRACTVEELPGILEKLGPSLGSNLFHTFGVFGVAPSSGRGKASDIAASVATYLDIDLKDCGLYANAKNPSVTLAEIRQRLSEWELLEPTAIVSTGNGYHFEFRLDEPAILAEEGMRERVKSAFRNFNAYVTDEAAKIGWKIDTVSDLVRPKRALGS